MADTPILQVPANVAIILDGLSMLVKGQAQVATSPPPTVPLTINAVGLALVMKAEGLKLTAYQDGSGVWTIGYGHTLNVMAGQTITEAQAYQLLSQDLLTAENCVFNAVQKSTDNQYSAMVSLTYNIGTAAFLGSSVLRQHIAGNYQSAADDFLLWDKEHQNGQLVVVPGLDTRRAAERQLYLT